MRTARALAVLAAVLWVGCTTGPSEFSDPDVPIEVKRGEEFAILLESNATTGYRWTLLAPLDASIVSLLRTEYRAGSAAGQVGAGGMEYWSFGAEGKGTTLIAMAYTRAGSTPASTAMFTVKVK